MALELNTIHTSVKQVLVDNNTITSGGLSEDLSSKVVYIGKVNPEIIVMDIEKYPFVTSYINKYDIESETHAKNQATGLRIATINLQVVAGVWNPNFSSRDANPATDDLHLLMRNLETVFRANTYLSNTCDYQKPTTVDMSNRFIDEDDDAHIRIGIMDLEIKKRY